MGEIEGVEIEGNRVSGRDKPIQAKSGWMGQNTDATDYKNHHFALINRHKV